MDLEADATTSAALKVQVCMVSECGPARPENQDAGAAWRGERTEVALVLADGMGGPAAGREGAEIVVRRSLDSIRDREPGPWDGVLRSAVANAHQGVLAAAQGSRPDGAGSARIGMGATVVLAVV